MTIAFSKNKQKNIIGMVPTTNVESTASRPSLHHARDYLTMDIGHLIGCYIDVIFHQQFSHV